MAPESLCNNIIELIWGGFRDRLFECFCQHFRMRFGYLSGNPCGGVGEQKTNEFKGFWAIPLAEGILFGTQFWQVFVSFLEASWVFFGILFGLNLGTLLVTIWLLDKFIQ